MGEFLRDLATKLGQVCPTFLHLPPKTAYPYITLEPHHCLQGLPWGPKMVTLTVKIWSRYAGISEILKFAKGVDGHLQRDTNIKILESTLALLNDGQTRVHTFRVRVRLPGEANE